VSVEHVFRKLQRALDFAGIPYMVTGSHSSGYYGKPRTTDDIDVVIDPTREQLDRFLGSLDERYYSGL